jgi:hypothetical protein
MPPVWLDQIPLRPKTKVEETDFEKLQEAAAQEAERLAAERDKQQRQSAARQPPPRRKPQGDAKGDAGAQETTEWDNVDPDAARTVATPIKLNLLA